MTFRTWLLTSTTYGTWLPGDARGFVSPIHDGAGPRVRHNEPATPYDRDFAGLRRSARARLKCPPIRLGPEQAAVVLAQFRETAEYRHWALLAAAVTANYFHVVVAGPEDVHSTAMMRDFKSYAARALNQRWPKPASGTWWTESGSRRSLPDERAVRAAMAYVRNQPGALAIWIFDDSLNDLPSGGRQPPERALSTAQGADAPRSESLSQSKGLHAMAHQHSPRFLKLVQDTKPRVRELTVDDVKAKLDRGEKFHLIDVREESEWAKDHLPGATHLGRGVLERDIEAKVPDTKAEIVLYCGGGFRSALAADNLQKMGYANIFSMDGGVRDWREKGYPLAKG